MYGQILLKKIPATPYKAEIMSLPQITPLGKKNTKKKIRVKNSRCEMLMLCHLFHARKRSFHILPQQKNLDWVTP